MTVGENTGLRYLNNAATSHPKPEAVLDAMSRALRQVPLEAGRSTGTQDTPTACRRALAAMLGVRDPLRIALLPSATLALNTAIHGILANSVDAHVVATTLEHNSVLRPLKHATARGQCTVSLVRPRESGAVHPADIEEEIRPNTVLVCATACANATGSVQPIEDIATVTAQRSIPLLIDAAQSAGCLSLDVDALPGRNMVAVAGHKALFGPTGTGALVVPDANLAQLVVGGTGVHSDLASHPSELPWRHEAGSPNLPGIAGLAAGVEWVLTQGVEQLSRRRHEFVLQTRARLEKLERVALAPLAGDDGRAGIVCFTITGKNPNEVTHMLFDGFGIVVRGGLHCAPLALRDHPDLAAGTIRASFSSFNTTQDADALCDAVSAIARSGR